MILKNLLKIFSNFIDLEKIEEENLYLILNLNENANSEEIKNNYRRLAKIYHPDKGGNQANFEKINKAYKILSNESCRELYDMHSKDAFNIIEIILNEN